MNIQTHTVALVFPCAPVASPLTLPKNWNQCRRHRPPCRLHQRPNSARAACTRRWPLRRQPSPARSSPSPARPWCHRPAALPHVVCPAPTPPTLSSSQHRCRPLRSSLSCSGVNMSPSARARRRPSALAALTGRPCRHEGETVWIFVNFTSNVSKL
jgi:hypothetical protein